MPWCHITRHFVLLNREPIELCQTPYPGHPKGCPNHGKRKTCPPKAKLWTEKWVRTHHLWVIWTVFDFGKHRRAMRRAHPDWSRRQTECCLYWQGTARRRLKDEIERFLSTEWYDYGLRRMMFKIETCPEAHGLNVTATMAAIGRILEWPPREKTYQVAVAYAERREKS